MSGPFQSSATDTPFFRAGSASIPRPVTKRRRLRSPWPSVLVTDNAQDDDGDIEMASAISDTDHRLVDGGSSTDDHGGPSSPTLASPSVPAASPCSAHFGHRDAKGKGKARDSEEEEGEDAGEDDGESEDGWLGDSEGEVPTPSEQRVDFETAKAMVATWPRLFTHALKQTLRAQGHELGKAKAPRRLDSQAESSRAVHARAASRIQRRQLKRRRASDDSRNDPLHPSSAPPQACAASDLPGPSGRGTLPFPPPCDQDITMVSVESEAEDAPAFSAPDDRMITSDVEREMLEHREHVLWAQRRRARGIERRRQARDAQRLQADRALRLSLEEIRSEPPPILPASFDPLLYLPPEALADIRASTRPAAPDTEGQDGGMQLEEEAGEDRVERRAESPALESPPAYEHQDIDGWWIPGTAAPQPLQPTPAPLPEVPPYVWHGDARGGMWSPSSPQPPPPFNARTDCETLIPVRFDHDPAG